MISHHNALEQVLANSQDFGASIVPLLEANNQVLAESVYADRDFPPFDRVTKDGIAISFEAYHNGNLKFRIEDIAAAGTPQKSLNDEQACIEVMTGAMLPLGTDTVIMYEHLKIHDGHATILKEINRGQNIHEKGSDEPEGSLVLQTGTNITGAEIGVLASVGKAMVTVKRKPTVCVVSTGDELVDVAANPAPYQIRKSNSMTLQCILSDQGLVSKAIHIPDDKADTKKQLELLLQKYDVVLLSGGVSKGKYDYLPETLDILGVEKVFHRIKQRPGKPFWFGKHQAYKTTVFAFPGNPASTFANYHIYFLPWLHKSLGLSEAMYTTVILQEAFNNATALTRFVRAKVIARTGNLDVQLIMGNGSGDLTSLTRANGFVRFEPNTTYKKGDMVPFLSTRSILR